jgi:hypothetical protein
MIKWHAGGVPQTLVNVSGNYSSQLIVSTEVCTSRLNLLQTQKRLDQMWQLFLLHKHMRTIRCQS